MRDYISYKAVTFRAKELLHKKPIRRGQVILESEPFVYVISTQKRGSYCDHCLAPNALSFGHSLKHVAGTRLLKPCKGCKFVWYCNDSCAMQGEPVHKRECQHIQKFDGLPSDYVRLMGRLIFRLQEGGDKFEQKYTETKGRKYKDLMNHYTDIKERKDLMKDVNEVMVTLERYLGPENMPTFHEFLGMFGRMMVNRFCLMDSTMTILGSALYLSASIFDHACQPNAYVSFRGKNVVIRSLVDMEVLDLSKIRIGYIDLIKPSRARMHDLHDKWFFWCDCAACHDDIIKAVELAATCENPLCKGPVQVLEVAIGDPVICDKCDMKMNDQSVQDFKEALALTKKKITDIDEDELEPELLESIVEKQGKLFYPLNAWRVRTMDCAFNAAYFNGQWALALDHGNENYNAMKWYYGETNPTFGLFLLKLGKIKLYLKMHKAGLRLLEDAEQLLIDGFGENHPIIHDQLLDLYACASEDMDINLGRRVAEIRSKPCSCCGRRKPPRVDLNMPNPLEVNQANDNYKLWDMDDPDNEYLKHVEEIKKNIIRKQNGECVNIINGVNDQNGVNGTDKFQINGVKC